MMSSLYADRLFKADKRLGPEFLDATEFMGVLRGLYDPVSRRWHVRREVHAL